MCIPAAGLLVMEGGDIRLRLPAAVCCAPQLWLHVPRVGGGRAVSWCHAALLCYRLSAKQCRQSLCSLERCGCWHWFRALL